MNKFNWFLVIMIGVLVVWGVMWIGQRSKGAGVVSEKNNVVETTESGVPDKHAEKIEVVHFHATQQCWSCITVGEYALKTVQEQFPDEYSGGKIKFLDVNADLPENYDLVNKYQARGSSLFVNAIVDGKDYIAEEANVWRLVNDEAGFKKYFGENLKKLLE